MQSLGHPNEGFQTGSQKFTNLQEQKAKTWSLALGFPLKQNQLIQAKKLFLMSLLEDKVWVPKCALWSQFHCLPNYEVLFCFWT